MNTRGSGHGATGIRSVHLVVALLAIFWVGSGPAFAQPAATSLPPEAFAQLPLMSGAQLSPDGSHVAYMRAVNGRRHLIIQKLFSADQPVVLAPFENLDYRWARWANDERLVFSMQFSDKRQLTEVVETRLVSVHRNGGELTPIVVPAKRSRTGQRVKSTSLAPPQIQDNVIDWLPDEPNFILVSLDEDADAKSEVRKIDIRDGEYEIVRDGLRGIQYWIADQNHEIRIGYGYDRTHGFIMMVRSADGHWLSAEREDWWDEGFVPVSFSADPAVAFVSGPGEGGRAIIRKLAVGTGELLDTVYQHESVDSGDLLYDPHRGTAIGVEYIDDLPRHHYFDPDYARLQASMDKAFPETTNFLVSSSADLRQILVFVQSDIEPGSYYYWDRDTGSVSLIAHTMPGLDPAMLAPVKSVWIEARDGVRMEAFLTVPNGVDAENLPTVVLPHGGPAGRDDRSFWFLSQFIASRGYAVLQPNFRGSTGYGAAFQAAGRREWGGKMQEDVTDATRWLIDEGIADPNRIGILGWSYGGYSAAMGVLQEPELYRCAVSINGVLNLPRLIADDKQYIGGRTWTRHMGLSESRAADVSPFHLGEDLSRPLLIIQARDDARVHIDQGEGTYKRLKRLKKDVSYVDVKLGGHSMTNEPARLEILKAVEKFLTEHLARS